MAAGVFSLPQWPHIHPADYYEAAGAVREATRGIPSCVAGPEHADALEALARRIDTDFAAVFSARQLAIIHDWKVREDHARRPARGTAADRYRARLRRAAGGALRGAAGPLDWAALAVEGVEKYGLPASAAIKIFEEELHPADAAGGVDWRAAARRCDPGSAESNQATRNKSLAFEAVLEEAVRAAGIEFETEESRREAWNALPRPRPHLLTPDIVVPGGFLLDAGDGGGPRTVYWLDAKNMFGVATAFITAKAKKTVKAYCDAFGPGALVYSGGVVAGYADIFDPRALVLGAQSLFEGPPAGRQ